MARRLTSLAVALAVLVPALGSAAAAAPLPAAGAHACCLRMQGAMKGCQTAAFTCCPAPERGRESTSAPSITVGATPLQVVDAAVADACHAATVHHLQLDARALARANAPPDPLYLRHLTLLV